MNVNTRRCKSLVKMSGENRQGLFYSFSKTKIKMNSILCKKSVQPTSMTGRCCRQISPKIN